MAKKKAKKVATEFPLTISFDSSKLRGEFTAWLQEENVLDGFASMVMGDRGSDVDVDFDSSVLVVVNEHPR